jgi:hypothetical protein
VPATLKSGKWTGWTFGQQGFSSKLFRLGKRLIKPRDLEMLFTNWTPRL